MSSFDVQFEIPLFSAAAVDALVIAQIVAPTESESQQGPDENAWLLEMARSIENQLRQIEQAIHSQNQLIAKAAGEYAVEITQAILQQDDELIQKRITRYVELALPDTNGPNQICLFVHSQRVPAIESWLKQNSDSPIEVAADDALPDGDCRFEFGESGLLASLDFQMERIKTRLQQAIAAEGVPS